MTPDTATLPALVHPATGEALDLPAAPDDALVEVLDRLGQLRSELLEFETAVNAELLARLDRSGSWTRRVPVPALGADYKIEAPSPAAGAVAYDDQALEDALRGLVRRRVIDETAALNAQDRTLTVKVRVPLAVDPDGLARDVKAAEEIRLAGVDVELVQAAGGRTTRKAGIAALEKIGPAAVRALAKARRKVEPPRRGVKIARQP